MQIKGILSFPALFTAKVAKGATDAKFGCTLLLPPTDPQATDLHNAVEAAKLDTFPSGYTGADECFSAYDAKYAGKDYYDPRFSGWWVFSCSAKADDKPKVVDANLQPVMDPSDVYPGAEVWVNANISGYVKGKGGIGGWLNGVMLTGVEGSMGRLDNKPTVDQMFAGVAGAAAAPMAPPGAAAPAPVAPPAPPAPAAPAAPAALVMTAAAAGVTYEQYMATPGWTDEMLIAQGLAVRTSF
jgi:hypothetical protein